LEHFKKLQENLEFNQNKCHPGNVPDTRRQCAMAASQWAQGVVGRPNPLSFTGWLHGDTLQEVVTGNPKPKVGGGRTPWPLGHVARPANHHLVSYQHNQIGNPSLNPYKYLPYRWKSTHHILLVVLYLYRFRFSSSSAGEALSGVKS
jgi:hypothetical protein